MMLSMLQLGENMSISPTDCKTGSCLLLSGPPTSGSMACMNILVSNLDK